MTSLGHSSTTTLNLYYALPSLKEAAARVAPFMCPNNVI